MTVAIVAKLVIDCTGRPPVSPGLVLVEGDTIKSVKALEDRARDIPPGAQVIDLGDETVLPGLVDAHVHPSPFPGTLSFDVAARLSTHERLLRAAAHLLLDLKGGTTTARILGELDYLDIALAHAIEEGSIPGPRVLPSGKAPRPTFGHGHMGTPTDGADNVRAVIRENMLRGARQIKMFVGGGISERHSELLGFYYTREEVAAGVEEAHRGGRKVSVHIKGGPGVKVCVEAGVDCLEHGYMLTDDEIELMLRHGTWLGATVINILHPKGMLASQREDPIMGTKYRQARQSLEKVYPKAIKAGLRYVVSSDGRHGYLTHGVPLIVGLGAKPMDAILSVTRWPAELAGVLDKVGTLEPGKLADIISVRGNPLENLQDMTRVHLVMKGGRRYDTLGVFDAPTLYS